MSLWTAVLVLSLGIMEILAQAPDDFDRNCRENDNAENHIFPLNWEILLDTHDYENIYYPFSDHVWQAKDFDRDGFNWDQISIGPCLWSLYTCTYFSPGQDNWLFSQYVNLRDSKQVLFNVTYRYDSCVQDPRCTKDFVTLYRFDVEGIVSDDEQTNPNNYELLFGDEESSRLQQGDRPVPVSTTLHLNRPDTNGIYLGVRDSGTCGQVERFIMYYTVCRARQTELVLYPQVATPPTNGPDESFLAECVPNAHNVTSLLVHAFSTNSSCRDAVEGGAKCECDSGYEISEDRKSCIECPRGYYRTLGLSSTCQPCPANTAIDKLAAIQCECLLGFYRSNLTNQLEGPNSGCTASPDPVTNLEVLLERDTFLTLSWKQPRDVGRGDFFYQISISDPSNFGETRTIDSFRDESETVGYIIDDLTPFTPYTITVSTHNGVSNQDFVNERNREVSTVGRTIEGVPSQPTVTQLCTVVIWQPPINPNGIITGYEVLLGTPPTEVRKFGTDQPFFITNDTERAQNIIVQVRALNSVASSSWTDPIAVDCSDLLECPTNAPSPTSTSSNLSSPSTSSPTNPPSPSTSSPSTSPPTNPPSSSTSSPSTSMSTSSPSTSPPTNPPSSPPPSSSPTNPPSSSTSSSTSTSTSSPSTSPPSPSTSTSPPTSSITQSVTTMQPCEDLTPPANGMVSVNGLEATYTCVEGFGLVGDKSRLCSSGSWTNVAPTCVPNCQLESQFFMLNGNRYENGSQVGLEDIGKDGGALLCVTQNQNCCKSQRIGEFYYPDGSLVRIRARGDELYRNRDYQFIRLNNLKSNNAVVPLGKYRCEILDACGEETSLYITLT